MSGEVSVLTWEHYTQAKLDMARAMIQRVDAALETLESAVAGVQPDQWEANLRHLLDIHLRALNVTTELSQTADALWARAQHHGHITPALQQRRDAASIAKGG
jgi:hypothetical protein